MLNSTILDVVIGLVFCFASVALFVSAINEGIASILKLRHKTLLSGIRQLLNDPQGTGLVGKLYSHALINPLNVVANGPKTAPAVLPAYIAAGDFADALIDVIQKVPGDFAAVKAAVEGIDDPQIKQLLQGFLARAGGNAEAFRQQIADWFDNAMNRLSGAYKRRAQLITFLLGLATAAAFNIDAFYVLTQLWARPSLAAALSGPSAAAMVSAAASSPAAQVPLDAWLDTLGTLPVGWDNHRAWSTAERPWPPYAWLSFVVGLLVTASSAVFGAPFWFDLLQSLVQIRSTGAKPPADRDKDKPGVSATGTR
jgi:hypothetical protein